MIKNREIQEDVASMLDQIDFLLKRVRETVVLEDEPGEVSESDDESE